MMEIRYKIWIESDGKVVFCHGRRGLLQAIDECRSLSAAVKKLTMPYRAAWGRLKASEERLGVKLVEKDKVHKGTALTPVARLLLNKFNQIEKEIQVCLCGMEKELSDLTRGESTPRQEDLKTG